MPGLIETMETRTKRWLHVGLFLAITGVGAMAFVLLTANKPQLKRSAPPTPVPVVRTIEVDVASTSIPVFGEGTVRPLREIQLVPQVSGKIVQISPSLVNGGSFKKGDTLLRIDPQDYELAVTLARARVKDSESALQFAEEEAAAALEEWRLITEDKDTTVPPLVAKTPQLEAAKAKLAADRAELQKAILNLQRTALESPFDGRVSEKLVDIGQYVTAGQSVATLFSTEAAEIVVPLEDDSLSWFHVPGFTPGAGQGAMVKVSAKIAGQRRTWTGRVDRAAGKLDERTRLIDVVVRVENPYGSKPPLAVGLYVSVEIQGRTLSNAIVIPRSALRGNDRVWVVAGTDQLRFRSVTVARLLADQVVLTEGLVDGEKVVISPLKVATDGMKIRLAKPNNEASS